MPKKRSRKSREANADQLLKVSNSLLIAFLIAILIIPIGGIIRGDLAFENLTSRFSSGQGILFILLESIVFLAAAKAKNNALDIYDELYPDEDDLKGEEPFNYNHA